MGVVDKDRRAVVFADQLHAAWHAGEPRQGGERPARHSHRWRGRGRALPARSSPGSRRPAAARSRAAPVEREADALPVAASAAAPADADRLRRHRRRRSPAAAAARKAPSRANSGLSALSTALPPGASRSVNSRVLGGAVGLHVAVIVEMVARQVGEGGGARRPARRAGIARARGSTPRSRHGRCRVRRVRQGAVQARPGRAWSARREAARGDHEPSVPRLAAGWPSACQISRMKCATEVLPLVPVTAAMVFGCGG